MVSTDTVQSIPVPARAQHSGNGRTSWAAILASQLYSRTTLDKTLHSGVPVHLQNGVRKGILNLRGVLLGDIALEGLVFSSGSAPDGSFLLMHTPCLGAISLWNLPGLGAKGLGEYHSFKSPTEIRKS